MITQPSSTSTLTRSPASIARFAWAVLGYNLFIIVWGAFVRASGSGAGCGSHWPLCNGQVIPRAPTTKTLIELTHRLTSGVALVLVVAMAVVVFRAFGKSTKTGSAPRRAAAVSVVFIVTEALIGAGLVLFELVAHDKSIARAFSMSLHLTNTFLLLACITLTALSVSASVAVSGAAASDAPPRVRDHARLIALLAPAFAAMLAVGTSGGIAALGDTLFPARSLAEGVANDFSSTAHAFERLRVFHPLIAFGAGLYVAFAASVVRAMRPSVRVKRCASALVAAFVVQFAVGLLNLYLLAPIAMQLLHLLMADAVWILLVVLAHAAVHAPRVSPVSPVPPGGANADEQLRLRDLA